MPPWRDALALELDELTGMWVDRSDFHASLVLDEAVDASIHPSIPAVDEPEMLG
jgi:hypothetical protein